MQHSDMFYWEIVIVENPQFYKCILIIRSKKK